MIVGSGIDVIEIARIEAVMDRRGERFLERVYTPAEIQRCLRAGRAAPHFALRFAAKEAAMKALGTGWAHGVRWVDLETRPPETHAAPGEGGLSEPLDLVFHGESRSLAQGRCRGGEARAQLALSRSRTHAMAVVLLESVAP